MDDSHTSGFTPPTAEQLSGHLRRCAPRRARRWLSILPFAGLGLIVGLTFAADGLGSVLLPVLALAALTAALSWRVRWLRRTEQGAVRVQELAATRHYRNALSQGWRLLPKLRAMPEMHCRTLAALALCLDQLKAYDSAIVAYDFLLALLPANHSGAIQMTVQRAAAQLMSDRLIDADDALRRLRGVIDQYPHTPLAAGYRLAGLLQQVHTYHFADAVAESDNLVESLRPLGVEAGFGYALMALAHFRLDPTRAGERSAPATLWWARATTLLSPAALLERFDQLRQIAHLPATPRPEPLTNR